MYYIFKRSNSRYELWSLKHNKCVAAGSESVMKILLKLFREHK